MERIIAAKVKIKQVPDDQPNSEGVDKIVETRAGLLSHVTPWGSRRTWDHLNTLCDPGHHAVEYEVLSCK